MRHSTILVGTLCLLASILSTPALAGDEALEGVMKPYEEIREALVSDSLDGVPGAAATIRERVEELRDTSGEAIPGEDDLKEIVAAAQELREAGDLEAARGAFYELSKPLVRWRQGAGQGADVAFCPMKKRSWLQPGDEEIANPYYGQEMAGCGEILSE